MRIPSTALLLLTAAITTVNVSPASPPTFAARLGLEIPGEIFTTGDYNNDGNQDVISVVPDPNSATNDYEFSVQLGNGKGSFTQGPLYDLGPNFVPTAIAAADVNGDGLLDVVILSTNTNSLYVLLQRKGREPVITPIEVFNTYGALNIGIGDVNGDGRPDLVIPTGSGIYVLLNEGRGNFGSPTVASAVDANFVVLADVNNDKNLDLVLSTGNYCCGTAVTVVLGDGKGDFTAPTSQPDFYNTAAEIAIADFNQDGKLDIAAASEYYGGLQIAFGNGDGTFQTPETINLPAGFEQSNAVAAGDLNKDGIPDVTVLSYGYSGEFVLTFLNQGQGVFGTPATYAVQSGATSVQLAPVIASSGTGAANDILVSTPDNGDVISVLLNNGKGVFQDGLTDGPSAQSLYLVTGDFNGDGHLDIASVSSAGLSVLLNTGTDSSLFTVEPPLPFFSGPLVAGNFNTDGRLDLVTIAGSTAELLLGEGNGQFRLKVPAFSIGESAGAAVAADMNGDGKLDLVTSAPAIILGSGGGNFQTPYVAPYGNCDSNIVAVADFNGDGKPDVLTSCENDLEIYPGNGDGTLAAPLYVASTGDYILSAVVADFNQDGIPDIAFTTSFYAPSSTGTQVTVALGTGDGNFQIKGTFLAPGENTYSNFPAPLVVGSFNGDSKLDLAVVDYQDAIVAVLPGNGDGTFGLPVLYGTGTNPSCVVAGALQSPKRPLNEDLMFCSGQGVSIDLNTTK
jgi:hypothetical protein